ncbi:hypothetical protein ACLI4Q_03165 [Natrialbaceae archaeon A-CW1-1]
MDHTTSDASSTSKTLESEGAPTPEAVLLAVANDQRRAILRLLNDADEQAMAVSELANVVAEHTLDGEPPTDADRRRVHTALHHIHLPKLEDSGLVAYDSETNRVRDATGELGQELLTVIAPHEGDEHEHK